MPRLVGTLLCILIAVGGCATRNGGVEPGAERAQTIDFARLRTEYGERDNYFELCEEDRPIQKFVGLANASRWQEVLEISEPWLAHCPIDIDAQLVAAVALKALGRDTEAEEHLRWYRGLVESILGSGDGEAPESAYHVISIAEEYSMLRTFGVRFKEQALVDGEIDALTVEGESGEQVIYFNPASHFRRLERELGAD